MIYSYRDMETGETVDREFDPKGRVPDMFTQNGRLFERVWSSSLHVPFQWTDPLNRPKYDKSPSGKKHYW
jgi:hypothetical protein